MQNLINVKLRSLKINEFAILEEKIKDRKSIGYKTELEFDLIESKKVINCIFNILLVEKDSTLVKLKVTTGFEIKEEDYFALIDESKLTLPIEFLKFIAENTISTIRGILYVKLEDSEFKKYIIPLINFKDVITEELVFEIENN